MDSIDKINRLLSERGITGAELTREIGLSNSVYSQWNTRRTKISKRSLKKIAEYFGVSVSALLDDSSPGTKKAPTASSEGEYEKVQLPVGAMPVPEGDMIPILGEVRCGIPIYADQNVIGYINYAGNYGEEYYALKATGDSMNGVGINPGDLVIVRKQPIVDQNDIAVVCVNGNEATLKRFTQRGDMVILTPQSTNPNNKPLIYNIRETPVHIMGRVMEVRKTF